MWEAERGSIPAGLKVLHRCDNTACINPSHLFVGTQRDNVDDMVSKGRAVFFGRRLHSQRAQRHELARELWADSNAPEDDLRFGGA